MLRTLLPCSLLVLAAGTAQAAFFSFASDHNHTDWTFRGIGPSVLDADDPRDPLILLVDDDNGVLPEVPFLVEFEADFTIRYNGSIPFGAKFIHTYFLNGPFAYLDRGTGAPILTGFIEGGALTAVGDGSLAGGPLDWDETATIQASDDYGSVVYTWHAASMPGYGLYQGERSIGLDDAAFTLTVLNSPVGPGVPLTPGSFVPALDWRSEGSYSGQAHFIPTPGPLALMGLAALTASRRRR